MPSRSNSFSAKVRRVLEKNNVKIISEGADELACLCPFHNNTGTPAMYVNKNTGLWHCFNPSCGKKGSLRAFGGSDRPAPVERSADDILDVLLADQVETTNKLDDFYESTRIDDFDKVNLFIERGFRKETLTFFEVGFYEKKQRIIIPVRDEHFKLVGFIGRSIDNSVGLRYKYSKNFPRGGTLFNLNNAKLFDEVIVVEGSTDAMKVHQAGFKNVVATLGASVSQIQKSKLSRNFTKIVCFGDADSAGEKMNCDIMEGCRDADVYTVRYPEGFPSDPGGMNEDQIRECIVGAESIYDKILNKQRNPSG